MICMAAGAFLATRLASARSSMKASVGSTVAIIFVAGILVTWVQPMYSAFTIVPLLAVGVALPYLRGSVLKTIMIVAWFVTLAATYLLETTTYSIECPAGRPIGLPLRRVDRRGRRSSSCSCGGPATACMRRSTGQLPRNTPGRRVRPALAPWSIGWRASSTCPRSVPIRPIHYVSPQVEELLGYTPEEWLAGTGLWASRLHPDDRARVLGEESQWLGDPRCAHVGVPVAHPRRPRTVDPRRRDRSVARRRWRAVDGPGVHARHHRPETAGGGALAPGLPRCAHRAPQPRVLRRST